MGSFTASLLGIALVLSACGGEPDNVPGVSATAAEPPIGEPTGAVLAGDEICSAVSVEPQEFANYASFPELSEVRRRAIDARFVNVPGATACGIAYVEPGSSRDVDADIAVFAFDSTLISSADFAQAIADRVPSNLSTSPVPGVTGFFAVLRGGEYLGVVSDRGGIEVYATSGFSSDDPSLLVEIVRDVLDS